MAMQVAEYLNAFMTPHSWKQVPSVNGSYRVVIGPHCRLLVKTPRGGSGKYSDTQVCAIDFGDGIRFWFGGFKFELQYKTRRAVNWSVAKELAPNILLGVDNIKESGVIDKTDEYVLLEFGETPYLGKIEKGEVKTLQHLSSRFSTIKEAQQYGIIPQENEINILDEWIAEVMPIGFEPPAFPVEYKELLAKPLNPLDFGFDIEECTYDAAGGGDWRNAVLHPSPHIMKFGPQARASAWKEAVEKVVKAGTALSNRYPGDYQGISVLKSRWNSYGGERIGTFIRATDGVYAKGTVRISEGIKTQELPGWVKLVRRLIIHQTKEI